MDDYQKETRKYAKAGGWLFGLGFLGLMTVSPADARTICLWGLLIGVLCWLIALYRIAERSGYHGPSVFIIPATLALLAMKVVPFGLFTGVGELVLSFYPLAMLIVPFTVVGKVDRKRRIAVGSLVFLIMLCVFIVLYKNGSIPRSAEE